MRRLMKRVAAAAILAACLVSLSACASTQEDGAAASKISTDGTPVDDAMGESIKLSAASTLGMSKDQLIIQEKLSEAQGDMSSAEIYGAQLDVRYELGDLKDVDMENAKVVLLADGSYTVMLPVTFHEGTMMYVMNLNMVTQQINAEFVDMGSSDQDTSVSGLLETATIYAAIGIGTVFTVLIFISLLISCFKFIHKWETGKKAAAAPPAAPVPAASAPPAVAAGPDLSDDGELAAVITAAIAAFEGTSSNGLVVRSIRRVQSPGRR